MKRFFSRFRSADPLAGLRMDWLWNTHQGKWFVTKFGPRFLGTNFCQRKVILGKLFSVPHG